jgi:pimeloyl-ACP methyl ester carboxylesterase
VARATFTAPVPGGVLGGWRRGTGPRVLLLHGGPGLDFGYMDELAEELGDGFELAAYQQRGLAPSTTEGPFEVAREVADAVAVLDALGWDSAWVVGHSWGGHLLLHLMVAAPERLLGGLAIDPLGGVGDGGAAVFEAQMFARTPEEDRRRAEELDARAMAGEGTPEESIESTRLVWPAYFASRDHVPPFPQFAASIPAYSGIWESLVAELPGLEAALAAVRLPFGCVAGRASPMPIDQAAAPTVRAIHGGWLDAVDGAGHFPWFERPGCVRRGLQRLTAGT